MKNRNVVKGAVAGLLGGLIASFVMNRVQAAFSETGNNKSHGAQSDQSGAPNHGVAAYLEARGVDHPGDNAAERTANLVATAVAQKPLSKRERQAGGTLFHYLFGAGTGAVYGALSELSWPIRAGVGLPFGLAVWLVADEGVVPALGLSKSASEHPPPVNAKALASHLVYGVSTDLTRRLIRRVL